MLFMPVQLGIDTIVDRKNNVSLKKTNFSSFLANCSDLAVFICRFFNDATSYRPTITIKLLKLSLCIVII